MEGRQFNARIGADLSDFERNMLRGVSILSQFAGSASRAGAQFAVGFGRSIEATTIAAGAAINRFTSQAGSSLTSFYSRQDQQQKQFAKGWGRLADDLTSSGKRLSIGVTAPLALLAAQSFRTYAQIDGLKRGLTAVMGSAEGAAKEMLALKSVSALPGLGMVEALQGSIRLQAVGFSAGKAREALLQFGNAIALTGGGKAELNSVTVQLGQLAAKGKVMSQDLRPIIEAAPAVAGAVQKIFGSIDPEVISSKLELAGKDSKYFIDLMTTELSKLERVTGGPKNAMENFRDSVAMAQNNFVSAADKVLNLTGAIDDLGNYVSVSADKFANLSSGAQTAILTVGGLAAAIGPLLWAIGSLISMAPAVITGINGIKAAFAFLGGPVGVVAVAVTAVIATLVTLGVSIQQFSRDTSLAIDKSRLLASVTNDVTAATAQEKATLTSLLAVARDEAASKQVRESAMKQLNALSPEYLGNLKLETINTNEATSALSRYVNMLMTRARVDSLTKRAADKRIEADKAIAQPEKEFADYGFMSGDRIAANVSSTFTGKSSTEIIDAKAKQRKAATVEKLNAEAKYYQDELNKAAGVATKEGVNVGIDFKNLGGESDYDKLKASVELAKDKIREFVTKNGVKAKIPVELALDFKQKSDRLKSANDAVNNIATPKKVKVEKQAGEFGDMASLRRLETYLESTIQRAGGKGMDEQVKQLAAVRREMELMDALTSKDQRIEITGIKELTSTATDQQLLKVYGALVKVDAIVPGIFKKAGANIMLTDLEKAMPTLDYYRSSIEEIKLLIASYSLKGIKVPDDVIESFGKLKAAVKVAESNVFAADATTDTSADSMGKWVEKAKARMAAMKSAGKEVKQTVEEMAMSMKGAHDTAAQVGLSALQGFGEGVGAGVSPLKAALGVILSILGDFMIKIGTAMILGGTLLEAATTAFPFLKPFLGLKGIEGAIAGGALVVGGAAVKSIGNYEKGGLFTGESVIRVGETSKALRGGGELVTSVQQGTDLIAKGLFSKMSASPIATSTPSSTASPRETALDIRLSGEVRQSGGDLIYAIRRAEALNRATGAR